jgi:hypothetical protein
MGSINIGKWVSKKVCVCMGGGGGGGGGVQIINLINGQDYVHTVAFSSVFSCNVFKKSRFQAVSTRKRVKTTSYDENVFNAKNVFEQAFSRWNAKNQNIIFLFPGSLDLSLVLLILKLKTLARNKTKYIAFNCIMIYARFKMCFAFEGATDFVPVMLNIHIKLFTLL